MTSEVKKETEFNGNKVHKSLWEKISKELSTFGVTASSTQCSNKWKAMKREYKKTVDDNSRTGAEKKTCPFYEEFNELYGNKSETRPSYVMSSSKSESVAIDEINDKAIMDSRCNSGS